MPARETTRTTQRSRRGTLPRGAPVTDRFEARPRPGVSSAAAVWLPCAAGLSICLLGLLGGYRFGVPRPASYAAAASLLIGPAVLAWRTFRRYELTRFDLVIRSGPLRRTIHLECIEGARRTRSGRVPTSAGCRGVGPVYVLYRGTRRRRSVLLDPEEPDAFLDSLARRSPFLERRGDRLVRRAGSLAVP